MFVPDATRDPIRKLCWVWRTLVPTRLLFIDCYNPSYTVLVHFRWFHLPCNKKKMSLVLFTDWFIILCGHYLRHISSVQFFFVHSRVSTEGRDRLDPPASEGNANCRGSSASYRHQYQTWVALRTSCCPWDRARWRRRNLRSWPWRERRPWAAAMALMMKRCRMNRPPWETCAPGGALQSTVACSSSQDPLWYRPAPLHNSQRYPHADRTNVENPPRQKTVPSETCSNTRKESIKNEWTKERNKNKFATDQ